MKRKHKINLKLVASARIHPAIGIARVGNSEEDDGWFIGPEIVPGPRREPGFYRDTKGRLKRQAARFRVYGYDRNGKALGELTEDEATIEWTVHVANKKAAWYDFDIALDLPEAAGVQSARRNATIQGADRKKLVIDPGESTIHGRNKRSKKMIGHFFSQEVELGELRTDNKGRLLFLGGRGKSGTPFPGCFPPSTFANNPGWHDDLSDGPVSARVRIRDGKGKTEGREIAKVESAWVIAAQPNFTPDLVANQTMYDVILDALTGHMLPKPGNPSFQEDILPVFERLRDGQWLNAGFFHQFGAGGVIDFMREEFMAALATAPDARADLFKELRQLIFRNFRDPSATEFEALKWPPVFGDAYSGSPGLPGPREGFAVTSRQFQFLQQWADGQFNGGYRPVRPLPARLETLPPAEQPATLDKAALTFCMGGPFHPAFEMTWPMRHSQMYQSPFRLRRRPFDAPEPDFGEFMNSTIALSRDGPLSGSGPGDITKWLGVPWQTDMASCRAGVTREDFPDDDFLPAFWVSRVPDQVLTEEEFSVIENPHSTPAQKRKAFQTRKNWMRQFGIDSPYVEFITRAVSGFKDLGVIERRKPENPPPGLPAEMFVESLPPGAPRSSGRSSGMKEARFNRELLKARFAHLRGRGRK